MKSFRLGFVGSDPFQGHEFLENRISIPYISPSGIVQMRFKACPLSGVPGDPEDSPKMMGVAGEATMMYNTRALMENSPFVAICEGEPDTWTTSQIMPSVGVPGAQAWDKIKSIGRAFRFRKVVILAHNDDKGDGKKLAEKIQGSIPGSFIKLMPDGYDVNKFVQENGLDALKEKIGL